MSSPRPVILALSASALLALGQATTLFALSRPAGIRAAMADPTAFDGEPITLLLWTVQSVDGDQARVVLQGRSVPIDGSSGLQPGMEVTVKGTFDADDQSVHATEVHIHRWRTAKRILGGLGTILGLAFLPLGFRIEHRELVARG